MSNPIGQHTSHGAAPNSGQKTVPADSPARVPLSYEEALRKTSRQGMSVPEELK